jgi:hypothetical protein
MDLENEYTCSVSVPQAQEAGTIALSKALETGACPQLLYLDVEGNSITEEEIIALGKALEAGAYPQLQQLGVEYNGASLHCARLFECGGT